MSIEEIKTPEKNLHANERIGLLLGSKALVQLVANPLVGWWATRVGYALPLLVGTSYLLVSSLGPFLGGELAETIGFPWAMRIVGFANLFYAPICCILRYQDAVPDSTIETPELGEKKGLWRDFVKMPAATVSYKTMSLKSDSSREDEADHGGEGGCKTKDAKPKREATPTWPFHQFGNRDESEYHWGTIRDQESPVEEFGQEVVGYEQFNGGTPKKFQQYGIISSQGFSNPKEQQLLNYNPLRTKRENLFFPTAPQYHHHHQTGASEASDRQNFQYDQPKESLMQDPYNQMPVWDADYTGYPAEAGGGANYDHAVRGNQMAFGPDCGCQTIALAHHDGQPIATSAFD
ncbi:unnamed protein product [Notodromas monacha]|uniref:Uncharacterized protein n=1 Tax=Notodromas monacha TaxID=399045 RepID=A0A7R9GHI3_9CRUS|nr:unnamed protein product [Notodromas monacha]CAG0921511.1 unnamed protein product [Notodromas monacha]